MTCVSKVDAGVCGFKTIVRAESPDNQNVGFSVASDCDKIKDLARALPAAVDGYSEIGTGFDGELMKAVRAHLAGCCAGCVVPVALFKSMQVAAGLALVRDIHLNIVKEE